MIVRLDGSAFRSDPLSLLGIFAVADLRRHFVRVADRDALARWCGAIAVGPLLRERLDTIADEGESPSLPRQGEVVVDGRETSCWATDAPQLTARDALRLLVRPLEIVLENGVHDRNFILAFADRDGRDYLERAERDGRLAFTGPGGIDALSQRVEAVVEEPREKAWRTYFLCDSDARLPGHPDAKAQEIDGWLRDLEVSVRLPKRWIGAVLEGRAAENYAPPEAVVNWAVEQDDHPGQAQRHYHRLMRGERVRRRLYPRVEAAHALSTLAWPIRAHVDLKLGRYKNPKATTKVVRTDDGIWSQLNPDQQDALFTGFGKDFSPSFYPGRVGLRHETTELRAILDTIRSRL